MSLEAAECSLGGSRLQTRPRSRAIRRPATDLARARVALGCWAALPEPFLPFLLRLQSFRRFRSEEIEAADKERVLPHAARAEHRRAGRGFVEPDDHLVRLCF